jgi:hypothetical protein
MSMSTRSAWRALHYSAKRRAFQPSTPYRCFSCANRAQEQKTENDRMTHFGFTNVPESEKESRGKDSPTPYPIDHDLNPTKPEPKTNHQHPLQSAPSSAP